MMKRVRWWEVPMAEIVHSYSVAFVELLQLQSNSSPKFPADPIVVRQKVATTLAFGYKQCEAIASEPPLGDRLEEAQYNAYVAVTSSLFILLGTFHSLVPWMSGPSADHRSEAKGFANLLQTDVMEWFTLAKDFPRIRKKDIESIIELTTRMTNSSFAQSRAITGAIQLWGESLEYNRRETRS